MRLPTQQELALLTKAKSGWDISMSKARQLVDQAYIIVFDDYVTGGPGWCGKLIFVIWDGGPEQHEVYENCLALVMPEYDDMVYCVDESYCKNC